MTRLFPHKNTPCVFSATFVWSPNGKVATVFGQLGLYQIPDAINVGDWDKKFEEFKHVIGVWPDPLKVPGRTYATEVKWGRNEMGRVQFVEAVVVADYRILTQTECKNWA